MLRAVASWVYDEFKSIRMCFDSLKFIVILYKFVLLQDYAFWTTFVSFKIEDLITVKSENSGLLISLDSVFHLSYELLCFQLEVLQ